LLDISRNVEPYDMLWLKPEQREICKKAYDRGVECILNCQIIVDGQPTVWCQQHDEHTLKPAQARAYELPSFCAAGETVTIVDLLLSLPNPTERINLAIDGAIRWLENHKIEGKAIERFINEDGQPDIRLVDRKGAPALWARFYDLVNGEPLFCGRDGIPRKHIEDIEYERRTGYSWFGTQPQHLIDLYKEWSARVLNQYILIDDEK
jgi:PelA/Pel-15E family pectate lyase